MDTATAWIAATWTGFALFLTGNVEPSTGVWVATFLGSILSTMTGEDRGVIRSLMHFILGMCVGMFAAQIVIEFAAPNAVQGKPALAFFAAMFSEKIVAGVHNGSLLSFIAGLRGAKK